MICLVKTANYFAQQCASLANYASDGSPTVLAVLQPWLRHNIVTSIPTCHGQEDLDIFVTAKLNLN